MGKIVRLDAAKRTRRPTAKPAETPAGGAGEVVIFTGVRYDRSGDGSGTDKSPAMRRRRRRG